MVAAFNNKGDIVLFKRPHRLERRGFRTEMHAHMDLVRGFFGLHPLQRVVDQTADAQKDLTPCDLSVLYELRWK